VVDDAESDVVEDPGSEAGPPASPAAADFRIRLKVKRKTCFGSAGCNVTYRIVPTYVGSEDLSSGSWDVTYVVRGGEDGPQTNTFTMTDGEASFDSEELVSTRSRDTKLTVKVVSVDSN
jgi:hypothetical protein